MIPPSQPYPLQVASGPWSYIVSTGLILAEGEPFLIGMPTPEGTDLQALLWGGHDIANHLLAGGFQQYRGDLTALAVPQWMACINNNNHLCIFNGDGWDEYFPGQGNGNNIGVVDGGTWV